MSSKIRKMPRTCTWVGPCFVGCSSDLCIVTKAHAGVYLGMQYKNCQPVMAPVIQGSQAASQAWNWSGVMASCNRRLLASASSGTRANCAGHPSAAWYLPQ